MIYPLLFCKILIINELLILSKATELRNICRSQMKRVQKVHSTETYFNRFGTLYLNVVFRYFYHKYFASLLLCGKSISTIIAHVRHFTEGGY